MITAILRKLNYKLRDRWLRQTFANGADLLASMHGGPRVSVLKLNDGTSVRHPESCGGLVEALVEVWYERSYLPHGFYTPRQHDVVVDIGANIGLFSVQIARECEGCRIVAVEPFAENFRCLKENLSFFGARATALQLAVGGSAREGVMSRMGDRSLDHVLRTDTNASNGDTVPVVTLDQLLSQIDAPRIALIKIDIEGSEHEVFEAASDAALGRCEHLAVEFHDHIKPGCLALIKKRLSATHDLRVTQSPCPGCGLVFAKMRAG